MLASRRSHSKPHSADRREFPNNSLTEKERLGGLPARFFDSVLELSVWGVLALIDHADERCVRELQRE
jgi:hypothetical protein